MSFLADVSAMPKGVAIHLPHGTWADDETLSLRPYFDGFAKEAALRASQRQVATGEQDKDGQPIMRTERDQRAFYLALVCNHIVGSTLRNAPTPAQAKKGERGTVINDITPEILPAIGYENVEFLLNTLYAMAGEPAGGYATLTEDGRQITFRNAVGTPGAGGTAGTGLGADQGPVELPPVS